MSSKSEDAGKWKQRRLTLIHLTSNGIGREVNNTTFYGFKLFLVDVNYLGHLSHG